MPITVQNIIHINANCADIGTAKRFFERVVGLTAANHLRAAPQAGAGMGLRGEALWDGYAMQDASGWAGTMLDLLQWMIPATALSSPTAVNRLGYAWLAVDVPDVAATRERARRWPVPAITAGDPTACWVWTPDGLPIEIGQATTVRARLARVTVNCRRLARTRAWYSEVLGFRTLGDVCTRALPAALGGGAPVTAQAQSMVLPGREQSFGIQLLERTDADALEPPLAEANAQGLYRLAVSVEDIGTSYRQLQTLGVDCPLPPCWLHLGPEAPVEGVWALFFRDPDGTCVELIQTPQF